MALRKNKVSQTSAPRHLWEADSVPAAAKDARWHRRSQENSIRIEVYEAMQIGPTSNFTDRQAAEREVARRIAVILGPGPGGGLD